jgi:hypothetical protein
MLTYLAGSPAGDPVGDPAAAQRLAALSGRADAWLEHCWGH